MTLVSLSTLLWIGGTVALTWFLPRRLHPLFIAGCSCLFLLYYSPVSCGVLFIEACLIYFILDKWCNTPGSLWVAITPVVGLLLYFKLDHNVGEIDPSYLIIPLGLSYYSLRLIHYAIERWKGSFSTHTFSDFLCYLFFLPTLMAGPINRFEEFQRNLRRRRWDPQMFSKGCERILYGYAKIVLLGNYIVSLEFNATIEKLEVTHAALAAYLDCVRYGLNLYFQFSGYSDIAIGFALLLGYSIAENFRYPFLATNISDFWKRWHISLSSWCRDYIYMGVWSTTRWPKLAVLCSMIILGGWHELSWRYLVWGGYHGLGIAVWQRFRSRKMSTSTSRWKPQKILGTGVAWFATMNFVILSFVITKEPDLESAFEVFLTIFGFKG